MANLASLIVPIGGDSTGLHTVLDQAKAKLKTWGVDVSGILKSAAIAAPFMAIGAAAFKAAEQVEDAMRKINYATGATGAKLQAMGESYKNIYRQTAAAPDQIVAGMTTISQRSGLAGQALESLTLSMLKVSKAANTDIASLAPLMTRVFGDWSVATDKQTGAMKYMLGVAQSTGTNLSQLSERVVQYGAPMRALGFSFEAAVAVMAKFEAEGVNVETSMAGMRRTAVMFLKDGITDPTEAFGRFVTGIKDGSITAGQALDIFGKKAGADLFQAIREGRFDELITGQIQNTAKQLALGEGFTKSFATQWTLLKREIEMAIEPMGEPLLTSIQNAMKVLPPLVQFLKRGLEGIGNAAEAAGIAIQLMNDGIDRFAKRFGATSLITSFVPALMGMAMGMKDIKKAAEGAAPHVKTLNDHLGGTGPNASGAGPGLDQYKEKVKGAREHLENFRLESQATASLLGRMGIDNGIWAWLQVTADKARDAAKQIETIYLNAERLKQAGFNPDDITKIGATPTGIDGIKPPVSVGTIPKLPGVGASDTRYADEFARIEEMYQQGILSANEYNAAIEELARKYPEASRASTDFGTSIQKVGTTQQKVMQQVSTAYNDVIRGISDCILHGKKMGEMFKGIGQTLADFFLRTVLEKALDPLRKGMEAFVTWMFSGKGFAGLAQLGKDLVGIFKNVTGAIQGASKAGSDIAGAVGGAASTAGSVATAGAGAVGSVGSAAGAAAGAGATAIVGAVAGVVGAVSGIIGNFQMAGMNKSLDILVKHTLQLVMINEAMFDGVTNRMNEIQDRLREFRTIGIRVFTTDQPIDALIVGGGLNAATAGGTFNFYNQGGNYMGAPEDLFNEFVRFLRARGVAV